METAASKTIDETNTPLFKEKLAERDALARLMLSQYAIPYYKFYSEDQPDFIAYCKKIAMWSDQTNTALRTIAFEKMYQKHPMSGVDIRLLKINQDTYTLCLIYRNSSYIRMAHMRDKIVEEYAIDFYWLDENSAYFDTKRGVMYIPLFYFVMRK